MGFEDRSGEGRAALTLNGLGIRWGRMVMAEKPTGVEEPVKMKRKAYEKALRKRQVELCYLQDWVKLKGLRVILVFEGRDATGNGGVIKAITERVSPQVFRVVGCSRGARASRVSGKLVMSPARKMVSWR
jgi:polyphosphate kinase 2 (PPK2 family)